MLPRDGIAYRRARRAFETALKLVTSKDYQLRDTLKLFELEECNNDDLPAILLEALDSDDDSEHLVAAWLTAAGAAWTPRLVGESQRARAEAIVSKEPRSGKLEDRILLARLLADQAPASAIPWLRSLLHDPEEILQICGAAALSKLDESHQHFSAEILHVLDRGVDHSEPAVAMIAARELVRIGFRKDKHLKELVADLLTAREPFKFVALATLREFGAKALPVLGDILAFAEDESNQPLLRGYAATVAATIGPEREETDAALLTLLSTEDAELLQGCLLGFKATGRVPLRAVDRLRELLSSDVLNVRIGSARAIQLLGTAAANALPQLLDRIGQEKQYEAIDPIADAIAAIGTAAIPELVSICRGPDFSKLPIVAIAISRMGADGALALGDAMSCEQDEATLVMLALVVRELAHRAGSVVPMLSNLLVNAVNEEVAKALLMALAAIGPEVAPAVPSILRVMATCSDELSLWAERALWNAGPTAIPAIEAALADATNEQEARFVRLLGGLTAVDAHMRGYKWFEELQDEKLVRTFVCVAEILEKGAASYQTAEKELRKSGRHFGDLAIGHRTLRNRIVELEKLRDGVRLTTAGSKRKGQLTDAGRALLRSARAYLRRKDALKRSS